MPLITITFNYPHAPLPQFKFGDRVALTDDCSPCDWLIGKVVGLTLDESYDIYWYYSIKLDTPSGLTEEYLESDLVPEKEIPILQAQWESGVAAWVRESRQIASEQQPAPKFQIGMLVNFTKATGCSLPGGYAQVVDSRYVIRENWSGFTYQLTNKHLSEPIEIGELWLEAYSTPEKVVGQSGVSLTQKDEFKPSPFDNPNYDIHTKVGGMG